MVTKELPDLQTLHLYQSRRKWNRTVLANCIYCFHQENKCSQKTLNQFRVVVFGQKWSPVLSQVDSWPLRCHGSNPSQDSLPAAPPVIYLFVTSTTHNGNCHVSLIHILHLHPNFKLMHRCLKFVSASVPLVTVFFLDIPSFYFPFIPRPLHDFYF